jgi:MoxR-like ATPase
MIYEDSLKRFSNQSKLIFEQIKRDMIGQEDVVENIVIAMIAGGNVLLEGVPGVGKTRLVRSLGHVFRLPFSRIQFTPDLMPADVTGTNIIVRDEKNNSKFQFQPGPIFSNIILADEINRATPKTQSALLEAMQEHTVTVMGDSKKLNEPFFVLATQNPIEQDGTYPLPEAQMDRFMFKLIITYPTLEELNRIVSMTQVTMDEVAEPVCSAEELLDMRATAKEIPVANEVMQYTMKLVMATHPHSECPANVSKKYVRFGASPRAAQALISAGKVRALINGRFNVSFADINALANSVLRHRIKPNFEAISEHVTTDDIVNEIIKELGHNDDPVQKAKANKAIEPTQELGADAKSGDASQERQNEKPSKRSKKN